MQNDVVQAVLWSYADCQQLPRLHNLLDKQYSASVYDSRHLASYCNPSLGNGILVDGFDFAQRGINIDWRIECYLDALANDWIVSVDDVA